jgi:cytochrome c2
MNPLGSIAMILSFMALSACGPSKDAQQWASVVTGGNPERGKAAMQKYGCLSCHVIDGLSSQALVGPPLTRMAGRSYLAGNLPNNASNMIRWIQKPREIRPGTAMPDVGVADQDARDIAAYLYQFK